MPFGGTGDCSEEEKEVATLLLELPPLLPWNFWINSFSGTGLIVTAS